jgi:hypothetical protein
VIIEIRPGGVRIHYRGWAPKFDEWLDTCTSQAVVDGGDESTDDDDDDDDVVLDNFGAAVSPRLALLHTHTAPRPPPHVPFKAFTPQRIAELHSRVDALDSADKWLPATVVDERRAHSGRDCVVRVAFDGWSPRYDEWLDVAHSYRIAPLHTYTPPQPTTTTTTTSPTMTTTAAVSSLPMPLELHVSATDLSMPPPASYDNNTTNTMLSPSPSSFSTASHDHDKEKEPPPPPPSSMSSSSSYSLASHGAPPPSSPSPRAPLQDRHVVRYHDAYTGDDVTPSYGSSCTYNNNNINHNHNNNNNNNNNGDKENSNSTHEQERLFRQLLHTTHGYRIHACGGDGNCLFRSVSHQVRAGRR